MTKRTYTSTKREEARKLAARKWKTNVKHIVTSRELARVYGVCDASINYWVRKDLIPSPNKVNGYVFHNVTRVKKARKLPEAA